MPIYISGRFTRQKLFLRDQKHNAGHLMFPKNFPVSLLYNLRGRGVHWLFLIKMLCIHYFLSILKCHREWSVCGKIPFEIALECCTLPLNSEAISVWYSSLPPLKSFGICEKKSYQIFFPWMCQFLGSLTVCKRYCNLLQRSTNSFLKSMQWFLVQHFFHSEYLKNTNIPFPYHGM